MFENEKEIAFIALFNLCVTSADQKGAVTSNWSLFICP